MAELVYFTGTMDCGKSTLALQTDYNYTSRGRSGLIFTQHDRAGDSTVSSRLGMCKDAIEVNEHLNIFHTTTNLISTGVPVDYLICDEVQFYSPTQIDQLADLVDEVGVDVFAFGISTDFRTRLFPGSARLIELADRVEILQVASLCWCGRRATHQARTVNGSIVRDGDQVVVGDVDGGTVAYEVLCRRHHRMGLSKFQQNHQPNTQATPKGAADRPPIHV